MKQQTIYVTYAMTIEVEDDFTEGDIMSHPEVTAPPAAEIVDWGFTSGIRQVR